MFVFVVVVRPVRCMYSLTDASTAPFFPCSVKFKAQLKGSINYFEERLGRDYVFNEIRD